MTAGLDDAAVAAIERACARLVLQSIRVFDEQDWLAYASLFTEDGVFLRANLPDEPLAGREAIRAALAARSATRLTRHLCTNIEIDVLDAEHARGLCYLVLYAGDALQSESAAGRSADPTQRVGEYRDVFVRTSEGWRIDRREGRLILYTTR
ncbi:MAG: nuclear transport factor 2 family protein [Steroidobacteraceae bacterium]